MQGTESVALVNSDILRNVNAIIVFNIHKFTSAKLKLFSNYLQLIHLIN